MVATSYKNRTNMKAIKKRMEELNNPTFSHEEFVMKNLICLKYILFVMEK